MTKAGKEWLKLGEVLETHKLPEVNPFDPDYPSWGTEERSLNFLKTKGDTFAVFTDGYAVEGNNVEFYIESSDPIEDFDSSWQKNLVYETGRNIVYLDDLDEVLEETEFLVLQLDMDGAPGEWSLDNPNGNIGLFIGLDNKEDYARDFHPEFKALNIKLMRPAELQYAIDKGIEGRRELAELYIKQGNSTYSSMGRSSVK